jgi:hypothetical protein
MHCRRGLPSPYRPIACTDSVKPETGAASFCSTRPESSHAAETTYATSAIAERAKTRCDVDRAGEKFRNPVVELNGGTAIRLIGEKWPDGRRPNERTAVHARGDGLTPSLRSRERLFAFDIQSVKKNGLPQAMERCHRLSHRQHGSG